MNVMSDTKNITASTDEEETKLSDAPASVADVEDEGETMVACTVRFTRETDEAIRGIAEDNGVSRASVVRYAVLGGLEKYLGSLKYVDRSQAQAINTNLCETANVMQAILNELRSIGVNYNQLTKPVNTLRLQEENAKFGSSYYVDTMMRRIKAEDKAKKETVGVVNEVADLIDKYVDASARLGAELWRIHE